MFDKLLRDLKKLQQGVSIPITLPLDDDGYLDRQCSGDQDKMGAKRSGALKTPAALVVWWPRAELR